MQFAHNHFLWLLLVLPPAMALFFWFSWRVRKSLMTQFIHARLLPGLMSGVSTPRRMIRAALLILAAAALVLALARPQWGHQLEEVRQRGLDIVVAIDTSKSMLAEDIAPNRLERAKLAARELMQQAKSDRLGLVAFSGSAFLQCPLTFDEPAFSQSLQALNAGIIPDGGSALAAAIDEALKAFKDGDNYKVLALFSDGEDHDSGALDAARKAAAAGLRIFTIGIGSAEGELLRIKNPNGQNDYIRDETGNVVKSRLNEPLLQQIAGIGGGFYLQLRGAGTIDTLYQKGLAPLPKAESKELWVRRPLERYHWPLSFALALLIAEMLWPERKKAAQRAAAAASPRPAGVSAALLLSFSMAISAEGSPASALRDYKSGRYGESLQEYERALQKNKDPRLDFNAGTAAYRNQQFDQAAKHFGQALTAPDLKLQGQAYYNLGNSLFRAGESTPDPQKKSKIWEESLRQYESSLKLDAQDPDAKFNHEFVKQKLEELKQQQQQQQQQNQQPNSDQNQDPSKEQQQQQQQDQSKTEQARDSQSQQQQQQQGQQQKQDASEQEKQQGQEKKESAQSQPEPKPGQEASAQEKQEPQSGEQRELDQARAGGEMSPEEARRLLDRQRNDEEMLPISRKQRAEDQQRPIKDW